MLVSPIVVDKWFRPEPVVLAAALALLLLAAGPAHAGTLLPERGGSPNADRIASLYTVVLVLAGARVRRRRRRARCTPCVRYRERRSPVAGADPGQHAPGDRLDGRGDRADRLHRRLLADASSAAIEHPDRAAATPAAVAAAVVAAGDDATPCTSSVVGRQYIWMYRYPDGAYSYEEMVAPIGVTVKLDIVSRRRRALLVDPQARRQVRRDPRLRQPHVVSPRSGPASTAASAPSCAGATTPTCSPRSAASRPARVRARGSRTRSA